MVGRIRSDYYATYLSDSKRWYEDNKHDEDYKERNRRLNKESRQNNRSNIKFKANEQLRTFIWASVRNKPEKQTYKYVGIHGQQYRTYLYGLFDNHMTWDNYLTYWKVDYVVPLDFFDLTVEENLYKAFSYLNTEPVKISR